MSKGTIYREDAITEIRKARTSDVASYQYAELFINAVRRALPADRPQGEWIETSEGTMCGNCHKFPYDDGEYHIANWHSDYCPNCGAKMKGAE